MKKLEKAPELMIGKLWFADHNLDDSAPISLKEYQNNIDYGSPSAKLSRGILISKEKNIKQLTFDCSETELEDPASNFRLFLHPDGSVLGKIEFGSNESKFIFNGSYKSVTKFKILIWGRWCQGKNYKEEYPILIELIQTKRIGSEFDKKNIEKKLKEQQSIESIKEQFFKHHSTAELKKVYKLLFNTPNTVLYVPIKEEIDRRAQK